MTIKIKISVELWTIKVIVLNPACKSMLYREFIEPPL
jgi:hypothetical protein